MKLFVKKLKENAKLPTRANLTDAGMDLYACEDYVVEPGQTVTISTGVSLEMEDGYVGLIWDKSSMGAKGIKVLGGVVDSGYRGEVKIMVHNLEKVSYKFEAGQKVAQMLIQKVEFPEIIESNSLSDSDRGEGGFGSTGK